MEAKLAEGRIYSFKVIKKISLNENEDKWILEDPFAYKLMIDASYYQHYNIKPLTNIDCLVDKINCTGKIYLEPLHPFYKKGEIYQFDVVEQKQETDIWGNKSNILVLSDIFKQTTTCKIQNQYLTLPTKINCKIITIKKGFPVVMPTDGNHIQILPNFEVTKIYDFKIIEKDYRPRNKRYYILEDKYGSKHLLPMKSYRFFDLDSGKTIQCKVDKIDHEGFLVLEPIHPKYEIGKSYKFTIKEIESRNIHNNTNEIVITVYDCFDNECNVFVENTDIGIFSKLKHINLKVNGFKKGKPTLILQ